MEKLELTIKKAGKNGFFDLRDQIDEFVENNFSTLYEGAVRLGCEIQADDYAPERVHIGDTRLHARTGLKYADGHKYSEDKSPSESQLRQTIKDLQSLIDADAKDIEAPFTLNIIENK